MANKQDIAMHLIHTNLRYLNPSQLRGLILLCVDELLAIVTSSNR